MNKTIRCLLCALAIIIGSAGSRALGAEVVDDLAGLKNSKATTWDEENQTLILNDDFIGNCKIEIGETLTLDLNGHSITNSFDNCFYILSGNTLTIIDNSTGQTKGSINCTGEDAVDAIVIESGGALTASGISITATNGYAVYNVGGTANLSDCTISGNKGIRNGGTTTVTGCSISGKETAIQNDNGTISINMGDNPSACTISGGFFGIYNQFDATVAIGSGVSIKSCSWGGIVNVGGTVTLNAWPAFGTGDEKNSIDIWIYKGEQITIGDGITAAPDAPITVRVTDDYDNDLGATDLPYTITTGYAAHVKDAQSAVIDPASVFAYYTDTPGYTFALGGSNDSEAVLTYDAGGNTGGDIADIEVTGPTENGDEVSWTFTMPAYSVKAEVEYVDAAFSITRTVNEQDVTIGYYETLAEAVAAAANHDKIVQLADFTTADMVTIDKGLYLNLNGHTYTSTNSTAAIKVAEGYALNLSCYNGGTDINGTLRNNSTTGGKGIIVEANGSLQTNYVSIASASDYAIYNEGYTDLNNSSINGQSAIYIDGNFSVNHTAITAADYGIYGAGGDYGLNAGVSISGCSKAGIYCNGSEIYISALPTFYHGSTEGCIDILFCSTDPITFTKAITEAPESPIVIDMSVTFDEPITSGYGTYVRNDNGVIDPADVFVSYFDNVNMRLNDDNEIIISQMVPTPIEFPVGNSTYYSNKGLKLMEGYENLKIYTVTGISGNTVVLTEIKSRTFPANTPVIVSNTGDEEEEASFYVAGDNYDEADFAATLAADLGTETVADQFKGTATNIDAIGFTAGTEYYGFTGNDFVKMRTDGPVEANRCWLEISEAIEIGGIGARRLTIVWPGDGDATGITGVGEGDNGAGTASDDALYSIDGRRVAGTPKKGIYIRGGQKVVVR